MRNAQQELNLHVNRLQASLEDLQARIERMCESEPDADGVRRMDWPTPDLPAEVIAAVLEGHREFGRELRIETRGRGLCLAHHRDDATPVPIAHG